MKIETMKSHGENSTTTMKAQLLKLGRSSFTGKIQNSSGNRIPAVSKVDIGIQENNELLSKVGVTKRLPSKMSFTKSEADKMNRYIGHQILRMRKYRTPKTGNAKLFFKIQETCLLSSVSFRVSAIIHVIPSWGYAYKLSRIKVISKQVTSIIKNKRHNLRAMRVYIKKANGKMRPLGVPTIEGRVALHMVNNMLVESFRNDILDCQHGYIPGRGTLSAGRQIIERVIDKQNIYETDIKGFFDNIKLKVVSFNLRHYIPNEGDDGLYRINEKAPTLPMVEKVEETKRPFVLSRLGLGPAFDAAIKLQRPVQRTMEQESLARLDVGNRTRIKHNVWASDKGVAQGAPTSPFIAILCLRDYLKQLRNGVCVNYADDQIFASNEKFEIKDMKAMGIEHAEEKCKGVRKDGVGLSELKFLGLIYNPWDGSLRSETRSERSIRIGEDLLKLWDELKYNKEDTALKDMVKRNFFGFIQACLYQGSFQGKELTYHEVPDAIKGSGYGMYTSSRTVSSLAALELAKSVKKTLRNR